jgi:hypothetical protein
LGRSFFEVSGTGGKNTARTAAIICRNDNAKHVTYNNNLQTNKGEKQKNGRSVKRDEKTIYSVAAGSLQGRDGGVEGGIEREGNITRTRDSPTHPPTPPTHPPTHTPTARQTRGRPGIDPKAGGGTSRGLANLWWWCGIKKKAAVQCHKAYQTRYQTFGMITESILLCATFSNRTLCHTNKHNLVRYIYFVKGGRKGGVKKTLVAQHSTDYVQSQTIQLARCP